MGNDRTSSEGSEHVVDDVADALTRHQEVEWDRCADLAAPGDHRTLANLRALARAVSGRDAAAEEPTATGLASFSSAFVRRAAAALLIIAALEVSAAMLLLPWGWDDYHREHGDFAVYQTTKLLGYGVSACLLLFAGRREQRSWLLGFFCLLRATQASGIMIPAFLVELPPPEMYEVYLREMPTSAMLFFYALVPSYLFAPAVLWGFARECPRVHRRTRLDDLALLMVRVSVAVGVTIWIVVAAVAEFARAGHAGSLFSLTHDISAFIQELLALAAVGVVAMRAHAAHPDEVRRILVFTTGMLALLGASTVSTTVELFSPGAWGSNYRWSSAIAVTEVIRFPGIVLLWYSVLAVRVPHPREVVRAVCRLLLTRSRVLGLAAIAVAVALAMQVAGNPERRVGAVISDPLAQTLFAMVATLVLALLCREPILRVRYIGGWRREFVPGVTDCRTLGSSQSPPRLRIRLSGISSH